LRWFWSILDVVTVPGVTPHGHAPTLDEAKAKFRDDWSKAKTGWLAVLGADARGAMAAFAKSWRRE
jgi:hypothetical protein